jgi:hypothetical protein
MVGEKRKVFIKSADQAKKLDDEAQLLRRRLDMPVLKNTVVVTAAGVSVVRFIANNPGKDGILLLVRNKRGSWIISYY